MPGGGVALLRAIAALNKLKPGKRRPKGWHQHRPQGTVLAGPTSAANAGEDGAVVAARSWKQPPIASAIMRRRARWRPHERRRDRSGEGCAQCFAGPIAGLLITDRSDGGRGAEEGSGPRADAWRYGLRTSVRKSAKRFSGKKMHGKQKLRARF